MANSNKKIEQEFDFEKGLERLEEIVAKFDEGGMTLDQMEQYFVEGLELVQQCNQRLDRVETRITKLIETQKGLWQEKPFDEEEIE